MIPFQSKLVGIKDLQERNRMFDSLSKEERVAEIGYDMLLNYINRKITSQRLTRRVEYWPTDMIEEFRYLTDAAVFQQKVEEKQDQILCSVCARGAIMVSRIKLGNKICANGSCNFADGTNDGDAITEEFSLTALGEMEDAYEGSGLSRYERRTAECIAAIGANLVANGKFVEDDNTDYLQEWGIPILDQSSIKVEELMDDDY